MRILQLCNKAPFPANDGSSIAIHTLSEGFLENNISLHILCINTKKHFKPTSSIPADYKEKTHYLSIYKNTNTSIFGAFLNLFSKQSYFVSRFFFTKFKNALITTLKKNQFDIIQLEGVFMATYIPTIRKYSSAKISLRSHNVEHIIWERHLKHEKNILKKIYLGIQNTRLKSFEINAFNTVDAIVTITNNDKNIISKVSHQANLHTCLTGVNLTNYKPVLNPIHPNTVFHFASMDWLPNIEAVDWLIKYVWNNVLIQNPNAQLILAGKEMPDRFKTLENKNIKVIEHVTDSKEFYNTYDIMLVPLWSGSGLRIKLVEGLAYGKAIITTSIGAEGIPYSPNNHMIIADNSIDFTKAILTLLSNQTIKYNLQASARNLAEQTFDYKQIAKQLITFYKTL